MLKSIRPQNESSELQRGWSHSFVKNFFGMARWREVEYFVLFLICQFRTCVGVAIFRERISPHPTVGRQGVYDYESTQLTVGSQVFALGSTEACWYRKYMVVSRV
jgi:hypothetical protein